MSCSPVGDPLVKEIVLLNKRPFYLHGYFFPFLAAYAIAGFVWQEYFGMDHYEIGIILVVSLFLIQILTVLSCFWSVDFRCWITCSKAVGPDVAELAKVVPTAHNGSTELVKIQKQPTGSKKRKTWIEFQKVTYVYDNEEKKCFLPIQFPVNLTFSDYQNWKGFATEEDYEASRDIYGDNVMEMVTPEFKELFLERATAPFFVFQVFCVGLWCLDEYWYYSLFTLFMLVAFEASLVYQQLRNMTEIRNMGNKPHTINVFRTRKWRPIKTSDLVAGDIISITRSSNVVGEERQIPCDILLLRGRLIVDEAMLTGESVPQMKDPIEGGHGDTVLDLSVHSRVHLISGGTRVVQHEPPPRSSGGVKEGASRPPDNGCVGYVLRTGFNTSQGKLLRTILFGVKRVTANNLETFVFIMFLLMFAIAASSYVWVIGSADPTRSRYKLVLNCVLILTSVVPPELPIELSLAVNSSLLALSKLFVYCTEPFRIPFAGKIDICCLDKTGTLTSDSLVVEGIAGVKKESSDSVEDLNTDAVLCPVTSSPAITQKVMATCHALARMDEELVGDPLEQAMLKAVEWNLTKGDVVIPKKKTIGLQPLKVVQRFHFSSALKRMSAIVSQEEMGSVDLRYIITIKGAAETLKPMFSSIPDDYDKQHRELSQRGARVLALGYRDLGKGISSQEIRNLKREEVEKKLIFAGFVIISSPLKLDSKAVMREIRHATHYITMITGDNPLTACHVGKVLKFCSKDKVLILTRAEKEKWSWQSVDGSVDVPVDFSNWKKLLKSGYDLCMTGDGLIYLKDADLKYLTKILPSVRIFARVSPKQKEEVITTFKQLGFNILMCGDGTNDVGALKHAHVGVALLSNAPERLPRKENKPTEKDDETKKIMASENKGGKSEKLRHRAPPSTRTAMEKGHPRATRNRTQMHQEEFQKRQKKIKDMMSEMDADPKVVKMGDASIAAPFSYKLSSIVAICHIIKQGRCTLVTTLQMFKILALNALVLAYSQSVLYLDGVKFSDGQATLQGLLLAGCFLFISRSKPLKTLSKERPLPNIFNAHTLLTITCQFAIHFFSLVFLVTEAKARDPRENVDIEADFEANLLNSTIYILSLGTQIITFAVNYRGHPFMESLWENKALLYSLIGSTTFLLALVAGLIPDINDQFEIVHFETEFRFVILQVLGAILASTWIIDRSLRFIFGSGRLKKLC
ncbi:endoplasmic reticulum transmembrane helix translocase-like [Clavelina lepadiformis]|uniref:endoplasmic reticulum transmembrane helix translocase-like n=1 Tax=Clavelina lepadiformis TaxID=159417 RepID=UPI004042949E